MRKYFPITLSLFYKQRPNAAEPGGMRYIFHLPLFCSPLFPSSSTKRQSVPLIGKG